jgi:hypothetical protein
MKNVADVPDVLPAPEDFEIRRWKNLDKNWPAVELPDPFDLA